MSEYASSRLGYNASDDSMTWITSGSQESDRKGHSISIKIISGAYKTFGLYLALGGVMADKELVIGIGVALLVLSWYLLDYSYGKPCRERRSYGD